MRSTHRLVLLILLIPAGLHATQEQRCDQLNNLYPNSCLCGEMMNSATKNGGSSSWEWGSPAQVFDMDDSADSEECYPGVGSGETSCSASPGVIPALVSGMSATVPSGNALTYVLKHRGSGICHVSGPSMTFNQATGNTLCMRSYARWDAASEMPPATGASGEPQQKIMTISGCINGQPCPPMFLKVQFSIGPTVGGLAGQIAGGADTDWQCTPANGAAFGNAVTHCTSNFCRFEACLDYSTNGVMRARRRMYTVPPGSGTYTPSESGVVDVGTCSRPSFTVGNTGNGGMMMFTQDTPGIIDYRHGFMVVMLPQEDQSFWIGPEVEFEGGQVEPPPINHISGRTMTSWLQQIMLHGWRSVLLPQSVGG